MVQLASKRVESASDDLRNGTVSHPMSSSRDVAPWLYSSLRHVESGVSALQFSFELPGLFFLRGLGFAHSGKTGVWVNCALFEHFATPGDSPGRYHFSLGASFFFGFFSSQG